MWDSNNNSFWHNLDINNGRKLIYIFWEKILNVKVHGWMVILIDIICFVKLSLDKLGSGNSHWQVIIQPWCTSQNESCGTPLKDSDRETFVGQTLLSVIGRIPSQNIYISIICCVRIMSEWRWQELLCGQIDPCNVSGGAGFTWHGRGITN